MRSVLVLVLAAACSGGGGVTQDAPHGDGRAIDAPSEIPVLTSFVATPSQVTAGVATAVTWTWTYQNEPTVPDPSCTIDNGVGAVTRGQSTMVTISAVTTFTLTCTNSLGSGARQVVIGVPPVAPVIASFVATPALVTTNAATPVTWTWTYASPPSPPPTCTIEHGVGAVTSGGATSVTLSQARTFRLSCTNIQGTSTATATVSVNECADATADCQTNATCTDTVNSYTCACKAGYTGNGDTCSANAACGTTPSLCSANATCVGGSSCVCNAGYVGDGLTCQRLRFAFVTSTTGNGNLSTWAGAGVNTGLAAADAICQGRATALTLPGTYVAWMSDSNNDAYCRVHGLTGKKANNCGLGALPVAAGPWARPNGTPIAPTIDRLLAPTRVTYNPNAFNEANTEVGIGDRVYTGTDDSGAYTGTSCSDWTSSSAGVFGAMGEVNGGGTSWTHSTAVDPACSSTGRLRCMETGSGPALPSRHPAAKKAFLTSVSGTGNLATWTDAGGLTGISAADAVCQARARYAGYANPQNFKALMSSSTSASSRFFTNGPWARPDGIPIAASYSLLFNGRFASPMYQMETGAYAMGTADVGSVWTGSTQFGAATFVYCSLWSTTASSGTSGRFDLLDARATDLTSGACTMVQNLYCVED